MLKNFRTYQLAVEFHKSCRLLENVPGYLKDQLFRASSSVALNLAEGAAKPTRRDQVKFYFIAMGSFRESQAALEFLTPSPELTELADKLGAHLHNLIQATLRRR
jgi:four helix bundle protein